MFRKRITGADGGWPSRKTCITDDLIPWVLREPADHANAMFQKITGSDYA